MVDAHLEEVHEMQVDRAAAHRVCVNACDGQCCKNSAKAKNPLAARLAAGVD